MALIEIIVKGNTDFVHGYLQGIVDARDQYEELFPAFDYDFTKKHLKNSIAESIGIGKKHTRFFISNYDKEQIPEKLEYYTSRCDFEIEGIHVVTGLSFSFDFEVYNQDIADGLREIIEGRPEPVHVTGYDPEETINEEAEGPELYSPQHDYVFSGKGTVAGPFENVIKIYDSLSEYDQVHLDPLQLEIE
jgi:ABC-type oligopeptide transport system substrate-binding subunit